MLQAIVYGNVPTGDNFYGLVNVTGQNIGQIQLPYKHANGQPYLLGENGLGYPPPLYPRLTSNTTDAYTRNTTASLDGQLLTRESIIILGPFPVNKTFSLFSMTMPVINNTSLHEILGWLTVILDIELTTNIIQSPEGLGSTGETVLIGPTSPLSRFPIDIHNSSSKIVGQQMVHYVLPPPSNSTLSFRHSHQYNQSKFQDRSFPMRDYPAVLDAWTKRNHDVDNAGAFISTVNEQNAKVSVGYAILSSPLVQWVLLVEQSVSEVVAPIIHLRDVVIICVFSVIGLLVVIILPIAHFSVTPIRALRAATLRTVQPLQPEGSSQWSVSSESGDRRLDGEDLNAVQAEEAKKEGFTGMVAKFTKSQPPTATSGHSTLRRRTFRIPGKVPERKHCISDELTDLTATFNEMSDELVMQYERLEERVKERTAQLEQSKKAAEVANESKTLFIANISHELKTPLNGILGLCAVCMQEEDLARIRSTLGTIYETGDLLLHLLTDLLTFSKNQIGQQLSIDESEFCVSDLGALLVPTFERQAREAQVDLQVLYQGTSDAMGSTAEDAGEKAYGPAGTGRVKDMTLWGDKNRILQVITISV